MRRIAVLLGVAAVALAAAALVALAAGHGDLVGHARISSARTITAGDAIRVSFVVEAQEPQPINWIAIDSSSDITMVSAPTGPGSWRGTVSSTKQRVIYTGGTLGATQSATFQIDVQVSRPAADQVTAWAVRVSTNGGVNVKGYGQPENDPRGLEQTIKVLRLLGPPVLLGPDLALDGTVTAGQTGLELEASVRNEAGVPLTIDFALSVANGGVSGNVRTAIQPGETITRLFIGTAGATGSVVFTPTARTPDGTAIALSAGSRSLVVQSAPIVACGNLTPPSMGADPVAFTFRIGAAGAMPLRYHATLSIATAPLTMSAPKYVVQALSTTTITVDPIAVPASAADGTFVATADLEIVDNNGMAFSRSASCGNVIVDREPPTMTVNVPVLPALGIPEEPGAPQTAAKKGDRVTFSARVLDGGTKICLARAESVLLRGLDAAGNVVATSSLATGNVTISRSIGRCDLTWKPITPTFPATAVRYDSFIVAADPGNSFVSAETDDVVLDHAAPVLSSVSRTTETRLRVDFSECVHGSSRPSDWTLSVPAVVLDVAPVSCAPARGMRGVDLSVTPVLDGADVTVRYARSIPPEAAPVLAALGWSLGYVDGSGTAMATGTVRIGATVPTPRLSAVVPGINFATNGGPLRKPVFVVSGVATGRQACVREAAIGTLGCATSNGGDVSVASAVAIPGPDRDLAIEVVAVDSTIGSSAPFTRAVRFDTRQPRLASGQIASGGPLAGTGIGPDALLTVRIDEALMPGADNASDWDLRDASNRVLTSVSVTAARRCDAEPDRCAVLELSALTPSAWEAVAYVSYAPDGAGYLDEASNAMVFGSTTTVSRASAATPFERRG